MAVADPKRLTIWYRGRQEPQVLTLSDYEEADEVFEQLTHGCKKAFVLASTENRFMTAINADEIQAVFLGEPPEEREGATILHLVGRAQPIYFRADPFSLSSFFNLASRVDERVETSEDGLITIDIEGVDSPAADHFDSFACLWREDPDLRLAFRFSDTLRLDVPSELYAVQETCSWKSSVVSSKNRVAPRGRRTEFFRGNPSTSSMKSFRP